MIEIKDVIHLYLGCEVENKKGQRVNLTPMLLAHCLDNKYELETEQWKPILRNLSDMTEEEKDEWLSIWHVQDDDETNMRTHAQETKYLLSKHFDLFNLHEQGLCLYSSDLK